MGKTIVIRKGDADTLTETVTGLASLAGYTAKMYIYDGTTLLATLTGAISGLTIEYSIVNESSKLWPILTYKYESKIFDAADHVYTLSSGKFIIKNTIEEDPS